LTNAAKSTKLQLETNVNRDDDSSSSVDRDESFLEKNQESVADVLLQGRNVFLKIFLGKQMNLQLEK